MKIPGYLKIVVLHFLACVVAPVFAAPQESETEMELSSAASAADAVSSQTQMALVESRIDINKANADTLAMLLEGIGTTKAHDIVTYREAHGDFESIEALAQVKGIGAATIARNRDRIMVGTMVGTKE